MIFLTGATGTFGQEFIRQNPNELITAYSRDELKLSRITAPNVTKVLGDIRDKGRILDAMRGCTRVIHAAALKRIEICEQNPTECVETNILGTKNVVEAAKERRVHKLVALSSDKAVQPINVYGASKQIMESIVMEKGYSVVRYGNVLGSRGSVLQLWKQQTENGRIYVTDLEATRFWITIKDAVKYVWDTLEKPMGKLYIPEMKSAPLKDLATFFCCPIEETGLGKYEKKHEDLTRELNSEKAPRLTLQELSAMIGDEL